MKDRIKVVVTGAAGQISYSLIPRLLMGTPLEIGLLI